MTKNLTFISTDRTFHFVWLPESIGKALHGVGMDIFWNHTLDRKLVIFELFVTFILPRNCFKQVNQMNSPLKSV